MPKQKKIAYKKCNQCRKDRQKCLPENRNWPGTKCERCQRYNYLCSAMRTKHQEQSMTSSGRTTDSPGVPSRTVSASPQNRRSEVRCLQDLGDLQQLFTLFAGPLKYQDDYQWDDIIDFLDDALVVVIEEIIAWARQHEADGRYRDAEYLFRRASSHANIPIESMKPYQSEDVLPSLVSIYEKMGDLPAAEMGQETLVRRLCGKTPEKADHASGEQIQAVSTYSRLLSKFQERIVPLFHSWEGSLSAITDLFITYRAAVIDISLLNECLLEQGLINSQPKEEHFCTSLHIAAKENAINLARRLIEMGVEVNSRDLDDCTPLHRAARYAGSAMIELLLANSADVEAIDYAGSTPLHLALFGTRPQETGPVLIDADVDINARDDFGETALSIAIQRDLPEIPPLLLRHGVNVEESVHREAPLFVAVRYQRIWAVDFLSDNGVNIAQRNPQGKTALDLAVDDGQESMVRLLLDHGRRRKITFHEDKKHGDTVLHRAISMGNVSIVESLVKARLGIDARHGYGSAALHHAILEGRESHERIVQLLLELDAVWMQDIDPHGDTALHLAVKYSRRDMLAIILQHIPDELDVLCHMRNKAGETPLYIARTMAEITTPPSLEISVLYLLEQALELSHSFVDKTTGRRN